MRAGRGAPVERVVRCTQELVEHARSLAPEDRIRQALCAWEILYTLHRPADPPRLRGFDTLDAFWKAEAEEAAGERPVQA